MKTIAFLLLITFSNFYVQGQQIANYNFSVFTGTMVGSTCLFWTNANLPNWFITGGTPQWHPAGSGGSVQIWAENPASYLAECESFAGNYNFVSGYTYLIRIGIDTFGGGMDGSCNARLRVVAANGLTEVMPSTGCGGAFPAPASSEVIGDFIHHTPVSHGLAILRYTPTANYSQILLYGEACDDLESNLSISIDFVSIASCVDGTIDYTASSQLFGGQNVEFSNIWAGSGSSSVVNIDPAYNTQFLARQINLLPAFFAEMKAGRYFLALPVAGCVYKCGIHGDHCVAVHDSIMLTGGMPGGIWSSSDTTKASVDALTGEVKGRAVTSTAPVIISYWAGECTDTFEVWVNSTKCHYSKSSANNDLENRPQTNMDEINLFPNPTQNMLTIEYSCKKTDELRIDIKDVNGRLRYSQNVSCIEGATARHEINISAFAAGVYFIELAYNDRHVMKKIIKL